MATHIKPLLEEFLKRKKKELRQQKNIQKSLNQILDRETKKNVRIKGVFGNQLVFLSKSSSFSYSFNLKRKQLLEKIQEEYPKIETIKLELG